MAGRQRNPYLDLIRCAAIMLVLGTHLLGLSQPVPGLWGEGLRLWEQGGWVGVDLFFVLSGFLISDLLLEEQATTGKVGVWRFLCRRGFKIYPSFYFFTGVATLAFLAEGQFSWPRLGSQLVFLQNYFIGCWVLPAGTVLAPGQLPVGIIDQAQWSLAVEEHFYLLIALVFCRFPRRQLFPALCLGMMLACLACRVHYALDHQVGAFGPASTWTQFRLDSLFFGALLAYIYRFHRDTFRHYVEGNRVGLTVLGVLGFLPFFLLQRATSPQLLITYGFTLLYLSSGCFLAALVEAPPPPAWLVRPLVLVGRYSYGIYLWHLLVRYLVWRWGGLMWGADPAPWLPIGAYLTLSLLVGMGTSLLVEAPFLRMRDRLWG